MLHIKTKIILCINYIPIKNKINVGYLKTKLLMIENDATVMSDYFIKFQ